MGWFHSSLPPCQGMISMVLSTDGMVILCSGGKGFGDLVGFWLCVLVWRQHFGIPGLFLVYWESFLSTLARRFWWQDWLGTEGMHDLVKGRPTDNAWEAP